MFPLISQTDFLKLKRVENKTEKKNLLKIKVKMECHKLNEGVYNKIESVLDNPKIAICPTEQTYYKSIYSPATLINDWYEKRSGEREKVKPEPPLSENSDKYRRPCHVSFPDRQPLFNKIFESYGLGQELLTDHLGFSYYDNYTTSYDLMYNHLTKGICGPLPRRYFKGSYKPETDFTDIFGNLTQWGLKERVYSSVNTTECRETAPTTETLEAFAPYDMKTFKKFNDFQNFRKIKVQY